MNQIYTTYPPPSRFWRYLFIFLPLCACLVWTGLPAIKAGIGGYSLKLNQEKILNKLTSELEIRRKIQKHFLFFGVYVPLYDINLDSENEAMDKDQVFLMRKFCGQGKISVWVPLRFRVPVVGEKVTEWCLSL